MTLEKTFREYSRFMDEAVKPETIRCAMAGIGRVGHFIRADNGALRPRHYPGFTLITPTSGDDTKNAPLYRTLMEAAAGIAGKMPGHAFVRAPESALHMTVARLVSGEQFEKNFRDDNENTFLDALGRLFRRIPPQECLTLRLSGITAMRGIIAAAVTADDEDTYNCLQSFRDAVYDDKALIEYNVERKRGFSGHITLLYIEDALTEDEKAAAADAVIAANGRYFNKPHPYPVARAEIRRFDNYLSFYRNDDWPVFSFGG